MADVRVLIVLGEIRDVQQKEIFENELCNGLLTCPPEILKTISEKVAQLGSWTSTSGENVLVSATADNLSISVLCRPTANALANAVNKLITPPTSPELPVYSALVYAGLIAEASAHWLLPNYVFTPTALLDQIEVLSKTYPKPTDAENQPAYKAIHLHVGCHGVTSGGEWRQLVGHPVDSIGGHAVQISVNRCHSKPTKGPAAGDAATPPACDATDLSKLVSTALTQVPPDSYASISESLVPRNWSDPMLKVARPCLYVFPEGSGQAAIFAIPGYNMLINAGCAHHPSFWPVANHLDRLDAVLLTHWGVDNLLGLSSVLPVSFARPTEQTPDSTLCLLTPPPNPNGSYKFPDSNPAQSLFALSIPREMSKLMSGLKQQGVNVFAHTLSRGANMINSSQPVQLYHKVGQGSLELFPLTPSNEDAGEVRKVADSWAKASPGLIGATVPLGKPSPSNKFTVPLLSHTSASALVIWKPSKNTDAILRILLVAPNAHQARVLVSLEALVASNIYLRHARAVPSDYERKRPVASQLISARPSGLPRHSAAPTKAPSVSSAGSSSHKPAPGRAAPMPTQKNQLSVRSSVVQPRASTKPTPTAAKKDGPASTGKTSGMSASAAKKLPVKTSTANVPSNGDEAASPTVTAMPAVNNDEGAAIDTPPPSSGPKENGHSVDPSLVSNNVNGFHEEVNDSGAIFNPSEEDLMKPVHSTAKSPIDVSNPLSDDLMQLNMNATPGSPVKSPVEAGQLVSDEPIAHMDPAATWEEPQGLPAPPPPASRRLTSMSAPNNTKATPSQLPPGYTDASSHAAPPGSAKLPPYDTVKPIYVDVAFLPGGGNPHLVDAEWFKRVRARYYVATDPRPGAALMEALAVGKESWTGEDAQLSASLILAHETEELLIWLGRNAGRLAACHLDLTAVASRSSIQLLNEQQTASAKPLTCAGYRIDF